MEDEGEVDRGMNIVSGSIMSWLLQRSKPIFLGIWIASLKCLIQSNFYFYFTFALESDKLI